jgi:hypothetical protein
MECKYGKLCPIGRAYLEIDKLRDGLLCAEAALSDIGDAAREPGDDLAWCEQRAAKALPCVRAALGFIETGR